jgi:hypothetical protein
MQSYIQNHIVGLKSLNLVNSCLAQFREYVARFPEVIKLTISPTGSYTSGLASRENSILDIVACMDGGALTNNLTSDQLALALSKGLNDWSDLASLEAVGDGSGVLILTTKNANFKLRIITCKPATFPLNFVYHSMLFGSFAFCDPRATVVITFVKEWAIAFGFSSSVFRLNCPFSGFHWTILTLYFLIESGVLPNLHGLTRDFPSFQRVVYGPSPTEDSFLCVQDSTVAQQLMRNRRTISDDVFQLCAGFFDWLSAVDLLQVVFDLRTAGNRRIETTQRKGWIFIADPSKSGCVNTVEGELGQKSQVEFAIKLRRAAGIMPARLRGCTENTFFKQLVSKSSTGMQTMRLEKGVP